MNLRTKNAYLMMVFGSLIVNGSAVVECLIRDRRAADSSLTGVTALCP